MQRDYELINFERCFIMLCDDSTEEECLRRNLFGDMARRLENLDEIESGDIGFLLNINRDETIALKGAPTYGRLLSGERPLRKLNRTGPRKHQFTVRSR